MNILKVSPVSSCKIIHLVENNSFFPVQKDHVLDKTKNDFLQRNGHWLQKI
jgi:hypothetical protein